MLAAVGIGAGVVVVVLPRLLGASRVVRFRLARWLNPGHIPLPAAVGLVAPRLRAPGSLRAVAILVLLAALGLGWSPALAILLLCAGSAAAAIPIGPGGAATQVGAGAAVLAAAHVTPTRRPRRRGDAQTLGMLCGAVVLVAATGLEASRAVRPRLPRLPDLTADGHPGLRLTPMISAPPARTWWWLVRARRRRALTAHDHPASLYQASDGGLFSFLDAHR